MSTGVVDTKAFLEMRFRSDGKIHMSDRSGLRSDGSTYKKFVKYMANQRDPILGSLPFCRCGASYFTATRITRVS